MDVFASIIEWAPSLPAWEQEAIRRLVLHGAASEQDIQELVTLVLDEPPGSPQALEIPDPQPSGADAVSLVSILHTCGVNALAPGQMLTFNCPTGLTVIYGDNGSGKSGYSRILKHACRCRQSKAPEILPDVFGTCDPSEQHAQIVYRPYGAEKTEDWELGESACELLATVALFDSGCCRLYVEEDGELAYRPYGLEVFDQLAKVCQRVKQALQGQAAAIEVSRLADRFSAPAVVDAISTILADDSESNRARGHALAKVSEEERQRAASLRVEVAQLETNDPLRLATSCETLAARLERTVGLAVDAQSCAAIRLAGLPEAWQRRDATARLAKNASTIAFGDEPLGGVGSDQWKLMFEHARAYSTEVAYPDEPFPNVAADSRCVLCQQPLGDEAKDRLTRFACFVANKAEEDARVAEAHYQQLRAELVNKAREVAGIDDALVEQLTERDETAAADLQAIRSAFATLAKSGEEAGSRESWEATTAPQTVTQRIVSRAVALRAQATEFRGRSDPDELAKLKQELALLDDRILLSTLISDVSEAASGAAKKRRLDALADGISTRRITDKAGEITDKVVTRELGNALNAELEALDARDLQVEFARKGSVGSQRHYLKLSGAPKGTNVEDVLSEGEHRCLGIAAFLAELGQAGHKSAIVLDDPVSSLDHKHRDAVAKRLVYEAQARQVVIYTHDLVFLYALDRAATELDVSLLAHTLARTGDGTGVPVVTGDYPETMPLRELLGHIRNLAEAAAALGEHDPDRRRSAVECYELMRAGYERVVEDVVLQGVVRSFDPAVHTQMLKGVCVEDDDHQKVFLAMKKCSEITDAHRTAAGAGTTRIPSAEELLKDVQELEEFRLAAVRRADATKERRKKLERAPAPSL